MSTFSARFFPRLHTRLGLSVGAIILALTIGLGVLMAQGAQTQVLAQSGDNLAALSRQMARELAGGMDYFALAVETQATRERFRDPAASPASMRAALDEFKRLNPEFAYVSIIDVATAKVVAASGGIFEGGDGRGRPVFERGKDGLFVGDVHGAVRLAELLPKAPDGEALRFLDVAAPVRGPDGEPLRVLATHVAWQWTDNLRKDVFGPLKASSGVEALLIDSQGKLVSSATSEIKIGENLERLAAPLVGTAPAVTKWADGRRYLTAVAATAPHGNFPGFGWHVIVRQPFELAAAPARDLRIAFIVGALGFGLVGAALAWAATGWLTRPVRRLAVAAARAKAEGAPATGRPASPATGGVDELSSVEDALEALADTARTQSLAFADMQSRFASLAESLPQIVFQVDATGVVDYVNRPSRLFSGDGAAPWHLAVLQSRIVETERDAFAAEWGASVASGTDLKARCRIEVGGEARWFAIDARRGRTGPGATRWVGTVLDVHELTTQAERTYEAFVIERDARLEAERLARLRDQFLAVVSHELRSPLSVITGWSDILKRKGSDNPTVARAAEVIRTNARIQTALINDLLDITAAMAGKLTLDAEPVDLARLGNEAVLAQLHTAQLKGVGLVCNASASIAMVQADRRRMAQVLANLVGNAIKFTDAGGQIAVEIGHDGANAVIDVRDTGIGMEPAFLPHVFEHMRQADSSRTRRAGGLGLGLAIVQHLVALHDGTVVARSEGPGRGSTFSVTLPLLADAREASESPDAEGSGFMNLPNLRILLVDDEADARDVAHVALSSLGAEVRLASSAAEVLQILEHDVFDVLVSDIGMPNMDGLELIRKLRTASRPAVQDMPAVALSAFAMESDRRAGLEAGFQAYVAKPISLRRLAEAIVRATEKNTVD